MLHNVYSSFNVFQELNYNHWLSFASLHHRLSLINITLYPLSLRTSSPYYYASWLFAFVYYIHVFSQDSTCTCTCSYHYIIALWLEMFIRSQYCTPLRAYIALSACISWLRAVPSMNVRGFRNHQHQRNITKTSPVAPITQIGIWHVSM